MKLDRNFYLRSGLEVAPELIGKQLVHVTPEGATKGIIVEVEAYMGHSDAAAHSYKADRSGRTAVQYGLGGFLYLFTVYGMHLCTNIVVNRKEQPEAILIRALEPTDGIELMQQRRNQQNIRALCNGPGKLTQAMGIQSTITALTCAAANSILRRLTVLLRRSRRPNASISITQEKQ